MILLCFPLLGTPFIQLLSLNVLGQLVSCSLLFFNFLSFLCLLALSRGVSKLSSNPFVEKEFAFLNFYQVFNF